MKMLSKQGLLLSSVALSAGLALTSVVTPVEAKNISYTAKGTTDITTAKLFQTLLKNSKELEVRAQIKRHQAQYNVGVTYTVTGKTSMKNARRLIKLFQESKHIQVTVNVTQHVNRVATVKQKQPQVLPLYASNYPAVYMQLGNNPYYWYPVAMWKPVPVPSTMQAMSVKNNLATPLLKLAER